MVAKGAAVNVKNDDNVAPLHYTSGNNYEDILDVLLSTHTDVDTTTNYNETPLYLACCKGHKTVVEKLLTPKIVLITLHCI